MSQHWKHQATRCAVVGCERQRMKGHSTCALLRHAHLGKPLAGAGRIEPIPAPKVQRKPGCPYCQRTDVYWLGCDDDHCRA